MSQLYPRILSGLRGGRKVIVSAIQGDLHEIGARMVADFFDMEDGKASIWARILLWPT